MTDSEWKAFVDFRSAFKRQTKKWSEQFAEKLFPLQQASSQKDTPPYPVETPVVYNTAFDEVKQEDDITIILIGDNPGKEEQRQKNRRYLVGQSGKIAEGFFKKNPELKTDFRKNVIILNKTPVHTAKTKHLRYLVQHGDDSIQKLIYESQQWMAEHTARLHQALAAGGTQLWLVGYSELREKGIFTEYKQVLMQAYKQTVGRLSGNAMTSEWESVRVFQHFSMNCFLIDLNRFSVAHPETLSLEHRLAELGREHRTDIFGA